MNSPRLDCDADNRYNPLRNAQREAFEFLTSDTRLAAFTDIPVEVLP